MRVCVCQCAYVSVSPSKARDIDSARRSGDQSKDPRNDERRKNRQRFKKAAATYFLLLILSIFKLYGNTVLRLATGGGGAISGSTAFLLLGYSKSGKNV